MQSDADFSDLDRQFQEARAQARARAQATRAPANGQAGRARTCRPWLAELAFETQSRLADEFLRLYGPALRFCYTSQEDGEWFTWQGHYWALVETGDTLRLIREFLDDIYQAALIRHLTARQNEEKDIPPPPPKKLCSTATVSAIERLSRHGTSARHVATSPAQWDSDPWLLGTPAGTVDLRTGELRPGRREELISKTTAVAPADRADCPRWLAFLERISGANQDWIDYLQRYLGYSLTGHTREHVLVFGYGTGANGKSVLANTVAEMLGDYAVKPPLEAFEASKTDRHPTELAMLRGARLAIVAETQEGRRWNEVRIKELTGGDKITARRMHENFVTFKPTCKLFILGNHKPGLRTVDEAMRRRMHLLPFAVTIPPHERDPNLFEALREEWPAIARWLLDGCLAWQRIGLQPPACVRAATDEYLAEEDAVGRFLEDRCLLAPDAFASSAALFAAWREWAEPQNLPVGTQKSFAQALERRGLTRERTGVDRVRGFRGLKLKP